MGERAIMCLSIILIQMVIVGQVAAGPQDCARGPPEVGLAEGFGYEVVVGRAAGGQNHRLVGKQAAPRAILGRPKP